MQAKCVKGCLLMSALTLSACATDGSFDLDKALGVGMGVIQATTLSEDQVKQTATLAAQQLDAKSQVVSNSSAYARRLNNIVVGLHQYDGLTLNFKVYNNPAINAFAMADGTVRVHSGLLDAMPNDQVLAVIGHEIGHVKLKHSYRQMKEKLLTDSALNVGGRVGALSQSQLGQLAHAAVNARFSQSDEHESDVYAVKILQRLGKDPHAMKRAIETLQARHGAGGGFLSSHPSNAQRIKKIEEAIAAL